MSDHAIRHDEAIVAFQSGEQAVALDIWEDLSKQGNRTAAWILGLVHFNGLVTDDESPDYKTAAVFFRQAAEQGHCLAQTALGYLLYSGQGVEKDESKARYWFMLGADQDDDNAQCGLGYLYETGSGGDQDYDAAVGWYSQAAKHGNIEAMFRLGLASLTGRGVSQSACEALYWLVRAGALGHQTAKDKCNELLPFIDAKIARRVFDLTLEKSPAALH